MYEIKLGGDQSEQQQFDTNATRAVRWLASREEGDGLREIADPVNIAAWNGVMRRAAVAYEAGEPIGVVWIATQTFDEAELGLRFHVRDDEAWLFAAVVDPEYRRQGIYRQLLDFIVAELTDADYKRILLGVSLGNTPSQKAHARQRAVEVGTIYAARIFGFSGCLIQGHIRRLSRRPLARHMPLELIVAAT